LELPNLKQEGIASQEPTTMEGFICNKDSHWFAIRKINGRYWNLNSTADRPTPISHFNVATELDKLTQDGYSVFCVAVDDKPLPPSSAVAKKCPSALI
jgi:ataxin-3